tara:strand:+ start:20768 stop:20881 length:114 start_codon:yes stop_codon:yes gene_type:complete
VTCVLVVGCVLSGSGAVFALLARRLLGVPVMRFLVRW